MGQTLDNQLTQPPNSHKPLDKSASLLDIVEKQVAEKMEKEMNMPIIWEPCMVQELSALRVSDVACGLDHSLVLCSEYSFPSSLSTSFKSNYKPLQSIFFLHNLSFCPHALCRYFEYLQRKMCLRNLRFTYRLIHCVII